MLLLISDLEVDKFNSVIAHKANKILLKNCGGDLPIIVVLFQWLQYQSLSKTAAV